MSQTLALQNGWEGSLKTMETPRIISSSVGWGLNLNLKNIWMSSGELSTGVRAGLQPSLYEGEDSFSSVEVRLGGESWAGPQWVWYSPPSDQYGLLLDFTNLKVASCQHYKGKPYLASRFQEYCYLFLSSFYESFRPLWVVITSAHHNRRQMVRPLRTGLVSLLSVAI